MSIPASDLVSITPRVLSGTAEGLNFNGVFLTQSVDLPADTLYPFYNASEVSDYFGANSDEYAAASAYFNAFDNSDTKPDQCYFFRHNATNSAAFVRSGTVDLTAAQFLAAVAQVTDGDFTCTINGITVTLTGISFAGVSSLSAAGDILQAAINGAQVPLIAASNDFATAVTAGSAGNNLSVQITLVEGNPNAGIVGEAEVGTAEAAEAVASFTVVTLLDGEAVDTQTGLQDASELADNEYVTFDKDATLEEGTYPLEGGTGDTEAWSGATVSFASNLNAFTITTGTAGVESSITNCSGSVAEALYLTEDQGAVYSEGADQRSYTETMAALIEEGQNWFSFTTLTEVDADEALELAAWSNTQYNAGSQFLYVFWSDDTKMLSTSTQNDTTAAQLLELAYNGVCGVYDSAPYAAFIMGACASVDWDKDNSTITLAYKAQSGLGANVQNQTSAAALENIKMNFVGNYASRNDNFVLLMHGAMFGEWSWIDSYLNSTWLTNELQVQILSGLQSAKRVPYNDAGYTLIRSWCSSVIERALENGVISTGVDLSTSQKTELQQEAGLDISSELFNNGYYLQINDADATVRQSRESPDMNLWYTDAGSVHRISMPVTTVQ